MYPPKHLSRRCIYAIIAISIFLVKSLMFTYFYNAFFWDTEDYVRDIMDPANSLHSKKFQCPAPSLERFGYLQPSSRNTDLENHKPKYFFALDLTQCIDILPRLMGSIVEAMRFLGPENCFLSIVEGNSKDGTKEILTTLKSEINAIGAHYVLEFSEITPKGGLHKDRIKYLAALRNLAIQPLIKSPANFDPDTTMIFINDVALCAEDILELVHQKKYQEADIVCAMDWYQDHFYDVWVGRTMWGDIFYEVTQDESHKFAKNIFWNDPVVYEKFKRKQSFQVFSCWNGALALTSEPFLKHGVRFRSNYENECFLGEPVHLAKDFWKLGYGRIMVAPTANVVYDEKSLIKIKEKLGTVTKNVKSFPEATSKEVSWKLDPPSSIKCLSLFKTPSWTAWNEAL